MICQNNEPSSVKDLDPRPRDNRQAFGWTAEALREFNVKRQWQ